MLSLFRWILVLLLPSCAVAPTRSVTPLAGPSRTVKTKSVFSGRNDTEVRLIELAGKRALARITGTNNDLTGKVLELRIIDQDNGRLEYMTQYHGRPFVLLLQTLGPGAPRWSLHNPMDYPSIPLRLMESSSAALEPAVLFRLHEVQRARGELAEVTQFRRGRAEQLMERELANNLLRLGRSCKARPSLAIRWATIEDAPLRDLSLYGFLVTTLDALMEICSAPSAQTLVQRNSIIQVSSSDTLRIERGEGTLTFRLPLHLREFGNRLREELKALKLDGGMSLGQLMILDQTNVCAGGEKQVVILAPSHANHPGVSYGDGRRFFHLGKVPRIVSSGWFYDPRFFNPARPRPLASYSQVEINKRAGSCTVTCGRQARKLRLLPPQEVRAVLAGANFSPPLHQREPYGLARSKHGIYYFVDRGTTEDTRRGFRVYIGRRGEMTLARMKDIVSDSKGEIFSTRNGVLKLVMERSQATWITHGRKQKLLWLPIVDNLPMIYNELGVYLGQRLGTPCDDI